MNFESRTRLAVVLDHPVQHFSPAFRELHRSTSLDTTVLYWDTHDGGFFDAGFNRALEWDIDLLSGHDWWAPERASTLPARLLQTWRRLSDCRPDVLVVFGWATPIVLVAFVWNLLHRRRLFLYGDSTWQHERGGITGVARRVVLNLLFRTAAGALSTGVFNREFYIWHGMHPERIAPGNCPADISFYETRARRTNKAGASDKLVVGFAGKLVAVKGVQELLMAAALLDRSDAWEIRIIGDGPERQEAEVLTRELGLSDRVSFEGFKNQSEMPVALGECDVVVVPSTRDRRVLVVTEAMAAGCTVVVSSRTAVWGPGDLVEHGVTGLVYESGNIAALADHLRMLIHNHDVIAGLVAEASARLDGHGPVAFAQRLSAAVRDA